MCDNTEDLITITIIFTDTEGVIVSVAGNQSYTFTERNMDEEPDNKMPHHLQGLKEFKIKGDFSGANFILKLANRKTTKFEVELAEKFDPLLAYVFSNVAIKRYFIKPSESSGGR